MTSKEIADKVAAENGWDYASFAKTEGDTEIFVCVNREDEEMAQKCGHPLCTGFPDYVLVKEGKGRFVNGADYVKM